MILVLHLWQSQSASALFLQQPQQQQQQQQQQPSAPSILIKPQIPGAPFAGPNAGVVPISIDQSQNSAVLQALGQFAAHQIVSGGQSGSVAQNGNPLAADQAIASAGSGAVGLTNSHQFVIKLVHNDPKTNSTYISLTRVNETNLYEPRIELRYQSKYPFVSLDERTPNNSVVAAVVVNDEDSGPNGETTLSIENGNELGHFKLVSTAFTNTIQVNGAPLSRNRVSEYNLTIVARDHGSPPKSSSSNLIIRIHASLYSTSNLASNNNAPLEPQPSSKPPVTDLMYFGAMLVVTFSILVLLIIFGCALFQRPKNKPHKGPPPTATSRTRSGASSRTMGHTTDQCSAYCLGLTSL